MKPIAWQSPFGDDFGLKHINKPQKKPLDDKRKGFD